MDRRTFIIGGGSTLAAVSTPTLTTSAVVSSVIPEKDLNRPLSGFTENDWTTIAAIQNHLFPSEVDAPGSVEIQALKYLHNFLSNPQTDKMDIEFILSGVHLLQKKTKSQTQHQFTDLSIEQKESVLREFEKDRTGRRWLITILNYILEALLTDPVYGGNPDGIGWKWLEHRAGEPRPPVHKRYWLL